MTDLYIIAGANGSGKTTFAIEFSRNNDLYFINADQIAQHFLRQKFLFEDFKESING